MSTGPIEVAEEALQKVDELENVDQESKDKTEKPRKVRLTNEERRKLWEEKQALKPVLERSVKGKVKWYSVRGKYGFIEREDGEKDIFVHQSAISKSPIVRYFLRTLADEEEVVFDVVDGDKGPEAANVTGPDGAEVQGSRYCHILMRRREPRPKGDKKESSKGEEEEGKDDEKKKRKTFSNRNRHNRKTEKKADADGEEESSKGEEEEGKDDEKKKRPKRQNRTRHNRKTEKKADADVAGEGSEEMEPKATSNKKETPKKDAKMETKIASPEGSGDASLGALPADSAAVC